jgi:hypothetical protein
LLSDFVLLYQIYVIRICPYKYFKRKKREKKKAISSGGVAKPARRNGINEGVCAKALCLCRSSLQALSIGSVLAA